MSKQIWTGFVILVVVGSFCVVRLVQIAISQGREPPPPGVRVTTPRKDDPELQAQRWAEIEACIHQHGVFSKVESRGGSVKITVTPAFYTLMFDQQQEFVSLVVSYYKGENSFINTARLIDEQSGKIVGSFKTVTGLKFD